MGRSDFVSRSILLADLGFEQPGRTLYVSATEGDDGDGGLSWDKAKASIQAAITAAEDFNIIVVEPGMYAEALTVPRATPHLAVLGLGGRGAVAVEAPADSSALTVLADDFTFRNLGLAGNGTGHGLVNYGRRTRGYGSKVEGGTDGLRLTLGTDAQITAGTHGKGDDLWFIDCEIAYNTNGVNLRCTDYGAVTQVRLRDCLFHDNSAADFEESLGSGGSAAVGWRDLDLLRCEFRRLEDGSEPAKYLLLNDDNGNKGVVSDCGFPTALAGGKNLVSTGLLWVANRHTGGISTGQPS